MAKRKVQVEKEENKYDWERVKQHLQTLPDIVEQIKYLDEIKTEYAQIDTLLMDWDNPSFDKKCELEIKKLERLFKLQKASGRISAKSSGSKERRDKGGTQYQNLLALYYLLHYLRADDNNSKKAKFASFLTGFSAESMRQQWSKLHRKKDEDFIAWEKDMKTVREYFQELGLSEIVKQIDNDLDF